MDKKEINKIFKLIEKYDSIVIGGHVLPDGDCYGSIMGLTLALRHYYPEKKIYPIVSNMKKIAPGGEQGIEPNTLDIEVIKSSLVFILDLANTARLDDKRLVEGDKIIKIDHHVFTEHFGELEYVEEEKSSTCEIVANMLFNKFKNIPENSATCLMFGLITDTGRFQYSHESFTFDIASKLVTCGAKLDEIYSTLYTQDLSSFKFKAYVYSHFVAENGVAYITFPQSDLKVLGVDHNYAASNVNLIAAIENYPIWISFGESEEGNVRVEFRCTRDFNVQKLAVMFGGGGHKQASGARLEKLSDYTKVIKEAQNLDKWRD